MTTCRMTVAAGRSSQTRRSHRSRSNGRTSLYCHSVVHAGVAENRSTSVTNSGRTVQPVPWKRASISTWGAPMTPAILVARVVFPEPETPATRTRRGQCPSGWPGPRRGTGAGYEKSPWRSPRARRDGVRPPDLPSRRQLPSVSATGEDRPVACPPARMDPPCRVPGDVRFASLISGSPREPLGPIDVRDHCPCLNRWESRSLPRMEKRGRPSAPDAAPKLAASRSPPALTEPA